MVPNMTTILQRITGEWAVLREPELSRQRWQVDEVFLTIHAQHHYLWRTVDQDGNVLDILVQRGRDQAAAKTFFRRLLKGLSYVPRVIITDKLASYGAAKRQKTTARRHGLPCYLGMVSEGVKLTVPFCRGIAYLTPVGTGLGRRRINSMWVTKSDPCGSLRCIPMPLT
jgi:hypothetical protein